MTAGPSITSESVVVQAPDQLTSDLSEEAVVLNLRDGVYYGLDAVGARIWELLSEPRAVAEVRDTLVAEYEVDRERCEQDLITLVSDLAENGLVEVRPAGSAVAGEPSAGGSGT